MYKLSIKEVLSVSNMGYQMRSGESEHLVVF